MNLENVGCPQPNPEPKGYFRTMLPHLSVQEPFSGMILGTAWSGWIRRNKRKNGNIFVVNDIDTGKEREVFDNRGEWFEFTDECGKWVPLKCDRQICE